VSRMAKELEVPVLNALKETVRDFGKKYRDRFQRARRIFVEERAVALGAFRDTEYEIKELISKFFEVPYRTICFAGSAQLGFSIYKDRLFVPASSDLDVACVDMGLFEMAWADIVSTTRAFTDETKFSGLTPDEIRLFKESILRRGMIRVELMPRSDLSNKWKRFEQGLSRNYPRQFGKISCAIYMGEYAFCWKQDATLESFLGT
jgi:hypothetical protein